MKLKFNYFYKLCRLKCKKSGQSMNWTTINPILNVPAKTLNKNKANKRQCEMRLKMLTGKKV